MDRLSDTLRTNIAPLILPVVFGHTIVALGLAFIPTHERAIRVAIAILLLSACLQAIRLADHDSYEGDCFSEWMFAGALHGSCWLVLLNLGPPASAKTAYEKLQWGIHALFSTRAGTRPARSDPAGMTKPQFLLRRAFAAVSLSVVWYHIRDDTLLPPNIGPADWQVDKDSLAQQIWHSTFTLRDLRFRAGLAFYTHSSAVFLLSIAHSLTAIVAVGLFNSPQTSWPPLFGDLLEAYSLRRWYSHFWHLATRKALTLHAQALASYIPGFSRARPQVRRATVVFLSFVVSGAMHTVAGWPTGACANKWDAMRTFTRIGVVIILEQVVQSAYTALHSRLGIPWSKLEVRLWKAVGYCWVAFYWLEITGKAYGNLRCHWTTAVI